MTSVDREVLSSRFLPFAVHVNVEHCTSVGFVHRFCGEDTEVCFRSFFLHDDVDTSIMEELPLQRR